MSVTQSNSHRALSPLLSRAAADVRRRVCGWLENAPPHVGGCGSRVRVSRTIILYAILLVSVLPCFASSEPTAEFDAANKLYAETKFAEAAATYEKLAQSGAVSSALLFNLGNAHYKAGQVGRAIAAYRRAEQLSPRDADLRANLQFVRSQIQGPTVRPGLVERSVNGLSLNEWAGVSAGALWLTLGLLALRQFRPALADSLRSWTRWSALATVALGMGLALAAQSTAPGRLVVVTAREATVRGSPLETAERAFTANDGAELRVLDHKDDWLQVTDGDARRFGWVKREQVAPLP